MESGSAHRELVGNRRKKVDVSKRANFDVVQLRQESRSSGECAVAFAAADIRHVYLFFANF